MRKFTWLLALAIPVTIISCQKDAVQAPASDENAALEQITTGNGSESGSHFTLNILGTKDPKNTNFTGGEGRRIFVALGEKGGSTSTRTDILLQQAPVGESFEVIDAMGFGENNDAIFQLPADVSTTYKVYARALGTPGGSAKITTCADADLRDGDEYYLELCSDISTPELTAGPKPKFVDVTTELLTIYIEEDFTGVDENGDPITIESGSYNLFDPELEGYFWKYDNKGLKLLQLRFYPINSSTN